MKQGLLALRDDLYRLMLRCLAEPERLREFDDPARAAAEPEKSYLLDRAPRYRKALEAWFAAKPPEEPLAQALALSEILFNHGLYFDVHEYLETAWKASDGKQKICLQGLIQIAAGFHKYELDPNRRAGALELLEKGLAKLESAKEIVGARTASEIARRLAPVSAALRRGNFKLSQVPRLRWTAKE